MSGSAAALLKASRLIAASGGFSLVGQDVDLVYTPFAGAAYVLAADSGSFVMSGSSVSLLKGFHLSAGVGAFSLTGSDVALLRNARLQAGAGAFSFIGKNVALVYSGGAPPAGAKDTYIVGLRRRRRT